MSKKIRIKILNLGLILTASINLVGCQLAKSDSDYKEKENLCGTFVTYYPEYDSYDYEDSDKKYYGNFDENLLDKNMDKYNFGNLNGYSIFLHKEGEGEGTVNGVVCDKVFQQTHFNESFKSEEKEDNHDTIITTENDDVVDDDYINITSEKYEIKGTMYVTRKFKGIFQFNPIIKENKKYYTKLGGNQIHVDGRREEGSSSLSGESDISTTNSNGKRISEKFTYTITVETVNELKSIKIKEMSNSDTVIKTKEIIHKSDEYQYKISKDTAYVIIEETCIDKNNKEITKRSIYDRDEINNDETYHLCNYANEDGIVIPKSLDIKK